MRPPSELLRQILAAGIRAPSAENVHYLQFQVLDHRVRLLATDHASWAEHPHRRMLALMSYGAVIENMALRSTALGFTLAPTLRQHTHEPEVFADLEWSASAAAPDPLNDEIESRHTNRRFFRRVAVPDQALQLLTAAANEVSGAKLLWLDDTVRRGLALKAIRIAETERFRQRALHAELFGAVRFDLGWSESCEEWLPPAALQVEPPMRMPFAALRHWRVMRIANGLGIHHALGLRAGYLPCALAPHIGLIVASSVAGDAENLQAGRAFQRVWLAAESLGLALQPMAAATVLVCQTPGSGWVSAGVKIELQRLLSGVCAASPTQVAPATKSAQPYMLFRLGRSAAPSVVTGRRPVSDYIG